jgi:hypothetical protein
MHPLRSLAFASAVLASSACPCEVAGSPTRAARCDCITAPPAPEAQAKAAALVLVAVDSVAPARLPFGDGVRTYEGRRATGTVLAAWTTGSRLRAGGKDVSVTASGSAADPAPAAPYGDARVALRTGAGGGDCGFAFEAGRVYLVYATGAPDDLRASICSRTRAAGDAGPDLAVLGPPAIDRRPSGWTLPKR